MTWKFHLAAIGTGLVACGLVGLLFFLAQFAPSWAGDVLLYACVALMVIGASWVFGASQLFNLIGPRPWMVKQETEEVAE